MALSYRWVKAGLLFSRNASMRDSFGQTPMRPVQRDDRDAIAALRQQDVRFHVSACG
jgi:hypothetical protein